MPKPRRENAKQVTSGTPRLTQSLGQAFDVRAIDGPAMNGLKAHGSACERVACQVTVVEPFAGTPAHTPDDAVARGPGEADGGHLEPFDMATPKGEDTER